MGGSFLPALALTALLLGACRPGDVPVVAEEPGASPSVSFSPSPSLSPSATSAAGLVAKIDTGDRPFVAVPRTRHVPMWGKPGSPDPMYAFDTRNPKGRRVPMLIRTARLDADGHAWFQVYLPIRPNGTSAWIRAEDVTVQPRDQRIEVDLSRRILERFRDGRLVDRFRVGVGAPSSPTGVGTFYVWVKVAYDPPNPAYGVYALGLSGFSPLLSEWPGQGRMAIHGTLDPSDRGQAVSHGCVRVYDPQMERLTDVPLGTPVVIRQ